MTRRGEKGIFPSLNQNCGGGPSQGERDSRADVICKWRRPGPAGGGEGCWVLREAARQAPNTRVLAKDPAASDYQLHLISEAARL